MEIIFLASATPSTEMLDFGVIDLLVKKGGHFTVYWLLALACLRGMGDTPQGRWLVVGWCLLYAISDEVHQSFVSGRNAAVVDVMIDMTGVLFAVWLYHHFKRVQHMVNAGM